MAIKHSELTALLQSLVKATSEGVLPEAAELVTQPAHRADVFLASQEQAPLATATIGGTGFKWGRASVDKMNGVDKRLVECATIALTKYTTQDFCIYEGLRTKARQAQLVAQGKSQTLQSKHLEGLALDLVPIINGVATWDWEGCYKIAYAMDQAATQLGIAHLITWGGAWDRKLSDFGGILPLYRKEVELYNARHPGKDFNDGPHFQIEKP